jgi:hypothetical protein
LLGAVLLATAFGFNPLAAFGSSASEPTHQK